MRFHCFYQTSDNANRDEWIEARDRNDAYAKLKARGIRPYRVVGRDPRRLPFWALVSLGALLALAAVAFFRLQPSNPPALQPSAPLPRAQIYGDTETLQLCDRAGWTNVFTSAGDAWLARHARPGILCSCPTLEDSQVITQSHRATENTENLRVAPSSATASTSPCLRASVLKSTSILKLPTLQTSKLPISPSDPEEYVKMKRMVNGMKEELAAYLAAGGTEADYRVLCCERLRTEEGVAERIAEEFDRLRADSEKMTREAVVSEWEKKNRALRALGLPTVLLPAEFL